MRLPNQICPMNKGVCFCYDSSCSLNLSPLVFFVCIIKSEPFNVSCFNNIIDSNSNLKSDIAKPRPPNHPLLSLFLLLSRPKGGKGSCYESSLWRHRILREIFPFVVCGWHRGRRKSPRASIGQALSSPSIPFDATPSMTPNRCTPSC
jgi:hypothetical protein